MNKKGFHLQSKTSKNRSLTKDLMTDKAGLSRTQPTKAIRVFWGPNQSKFVQYDTNPETNSTTASLYYNPPKDWMTNYHFSIPKVVRIYCDCGKMIYGANLEGNNSDRNVPAYYEIFKQLINTYKTNKIFINPFLPRLFNLNNQTLFFDDLNHIPELESRDTFDTFSAINRIELWLCTLPFRVTTDDETDKLFFFTGEFDPSLSVSFLSTEVLNIIIITNLATGYFTFNGANFLVHENITTETNIRKQIKNDYKLFPNFKTVVILDDNTIGYDWDLINELFPLDFSIDGGNTASELLYPETGDLFSENYGKIYTGADHLDNMEAKLIEWVNIMSMYGFSYGGRSGPDMGKLTNIIKNNWPNV